MEEGGFGLARGCALENCAVGHEFEILVEAGEVLGGVVADEVDHGVDVVGVVHSALERAAHPFFGGAADGLLEIRVKYHLSIHF